MKKILITILILCMAVSLGFAQGKKSAHKSGLPVPGTTNYVLTWDGTKAVWAAASAGSDSVWNIITLGSDAENVSGKTVWISAGGATADLEINDTDQLVGSGFSGGYLYEADSNISFTFGRVKVGSPASDIAYFSHVDFLSTGSYALKQDSFGGSAINAAAGQNIGFSISNSNKMVIVGATGNVGIGTGAPTNLLNVDGAYNFFVDSSSVSDNWGFVTTGLEVLTTGMSIYVQIAVANTDGATLQINALGAKAVHKLHNQDLATNDVEVGQILHLIYDGTDFQLLSQLAQ